MHFEDVSIFNNKLPLGITITLSVPFKAKNSFLLTITLGKSMDLSFLNAAAQAKGNEKS
jgi:hypothetical protein